MGRYGKWIVLICSCFLYLNNKYHKKLNVCKQAGGYFLVDEEICLKKESLLP